MTITGLPAGSVTAGTTVALGSIVTNPSAVLQSAGFSESWTIQFGGATYGPYYGPALNLTLGSVGSYTVALTATDAEGISSTTTQISHRRRHRPGRHARGLAHGTAARAGDHHRVQPWQRAWAPASTTRAGFVTVNWGDGTLATSFPISSQGSLGLQAHAYELPGNYQVTVTVTDVYGLSGSESFTTTVAPVAPSPEIQSAPASMNAGSSVTLSSSVTDLSQAETAAGYVVRLERATERLALHPPGQPVDERPEPGFRPHARRQLHDQPLRRRTPAAAWVSRLAQTIVVNDVTPTLSAISAPVTVSSGVTFSVSANFTDPDPGVTHTAVWTWGDSTTSTGTVTAPNGAAPGLVTGSHTYMMPGCYTITLTLTGSDGLTAQATAKVEASQSIIVLDPTAGGALSLSGNATIKIPGIPGGRLELDDRPFGQRQRVGHRLQHSGRGEGPKSGNATFSPAPTTGAPVVLNPLAGLAAPSTSG